jgi:hypothetical protein
MQGKINNYLEASARRESGGGGSDGGSEDESLGGHDGE